MTKYFKRFLYSGLAMLGIMAPASLILALRFFENERIMSAGLYNAGVDVLGIFVCAVLFFGCLGSKDQEIQESAHYFIMLIILNGMTFFINEWIWFSSGLAEKRTLILILNAAAEWMDVGLVYFFYRYVRTSLNFQGKLANWTDKAFELALIPAASFLLINFITPVCFGVNESGYYYQTSLYWLTDLYLYLVAPVTSYMLLRCGASKRQKIVSLSFIAIPIIHYLVSDGAHAYATQYGSVLVSIILIYSFVFMERSAKLASTQSELNTAAQIQETMLPHIFPPFPGKEEFELYASMNPAKGVGGDFYDFFLIDDDHLCMVMADVSGKGIPAALFMMASKIILQSCAMLGSSPCQILSKTNEAICSNNAQEMFVTVWLGILEISTGKLTASNAGHEYPAIKKADGDFELLKDRHGFVIGGIPESTYSEYEIQLNPGDKIFLYTDGVPEASDKDNHMFGNDNMLKALNQDKEAHVEQILKNVRSAVNDFVKDAEQFDDLTMLCMEFKGTESI